MNENRKLAAILAGDIVGFSRLAGADEDRTLASLRALRKDLIDPSIAAHRGRVVKRTGDGFIVEFRSVVDAVRCAVEIQRAMVERNAGAPGDQRIEFRMGVHLGDVVEESDGDLMGDGVNIAARIEGIAEAGGVCVSGAAHEQVRDKVKEPFVDLGERNLKNIARPVRIFAIRRIMAGGIETPAQAPEGTGPPRLSIVVLPFANIGGDLEHEAFVDGVTESLTTDLSRMSGMLVIGRNTAFTYKGKAVDLKQIGRELNVRYLLEGSVQRAGGRMRVNVQLVAAESGNHLWAERFDKPLADLFDMQDEIVARLANTLNTQLVAAEARRAAHAPNPDSVDLYFQGMARLNKGVATGNVADAHGFFERALVLDPGNVDAMVGSAIANVFVAAAFVDDAGGALLARTEATLIKALTLAPDHAGAHCWLGRLLIGSKRAALGIAECERALQLDRNLASAHAFIGLGKNAVGRAEETRAHVEEALRLSPRDTLAYRWMVIAGSAELALGADEDAVRWLQRAVESNRTSAIAHYLFAGALMRLGRIEEARSAVKEAQAIDPHFTVQRFRLGAASDNPAFLARRERVIESLRAAGVPDR